MVDNKDSKREKSSEIYTKKEKINIHPVGLYRTLKVKPLRNPGGVHRAASADLLCFDRVQFKLELESSLK